MRVRRTAGMAALIGAGLTAGIGGSMIVGAGRSPSGTDPTPTTGYAITKDSREVVTSADTPLGVAVNAVLPSDARAKSISSYKGGGADYDDIDATTDDGTGYDVTIYRVFAVSELDGDGMKKVPHAGGTVWVGADDHDLTSIYFLASNRVGLYVSYASPHSRSRSVTSLEQIAAKLTHEQAVLAAARPT